MDHNAFGNFLAIMMAFCIGLPLLILFIWSVLWAYADAKKRGKSGWLVALLVFLVQWPAGLIIWLLIRPHEKQPSY
ncbi:MAG: hypothetical protein KC425_21715 [Anaerolineales bacterium]|nr:hypothetical protein [Anaerolineales bacterium]